MECEQVLHLGGNGHAAIRLDRAVAALSRRPDAPRLRDIPYPGFEGRSRAASLEAFLDQIALSVGEVPSGPVAAYGSGIGGLIALALRSRGHLTGVPLVLQAPVLWGLERRLFPRFMRWRIPRALLARAFRNARFQDRFIRKQFRRPLDLDLKAGFFDGYAQCGAFADFFEWFNPAFLRDLERRFAARPEALRQVTIWWGGQDHVVDLEELRITERALQVQWPVIEFPGWCHYPMIDEPEEWAEALCNAVACHSSEMGPPSSLPGSVHPKTL